MRTKGHVFIADESAMQVVGERQLFGVMAEERERPMWRKTRADILADLSCIRPGDRLFFYNIDNKGFWGIYEATTRLYYDTTDVGFNVLAPYRIGLRPFLTLKKPISEHNLFSRKDAVRDFRSIFFKKVLSRGKACTHLFPDELDALTKALLMQNDDIPESPSAPPLPPQYPAMPPDAELDKGELSLEKELEWWLTYHLDSHDECRKIFGAPEDIEVFANYVPITISGGNIDLVVYHRKSTAEIDVRHKISIVEIKKGTARAVALSEIDNYTRWFARNITGAENSDIIQPIIIASKFDENTVFPGCRHWNLSARKPRLFSYTAAAVGAVSFTEVMYDEPDRDELPLRDKRDE